MKGTVTAQRTMKMENSPSWKGGRTITPHGYVLIKKPDHPYANKNGYVYEHRLVMENILGRFLLPTEIVHHKNGKGTDNSPQNLVLVSGIAEHKVCHRKRQDLRKPDDDNMLIQCACGCGKQIMKYDGMGRPRMFVTGHQRRLLSRETREQIRQLNASGISTRDIAKRFNVSKSLIGKIAKGVRYAATNL